VDEELSISSTVVGMFRDSLVDPQYPDVPVEGNNRSLQKINKRTIEYYDPADTHASVPKGIKFEPPTLKSHYEKLAVKEPFYFQVKKDEPSDIQGAIMVGNEELVKLGILKA